MDNLTEEAIIGSFIQTPKLYYYFADQLSESLFQDVRTRTVYRTIVNQKQEFDLVTISSELRSQNKLDKAGGLLYVSNLTNNATWQSQVQLHINTLKQQYKRKQLQHLSYYVNNRLKDNDKTEAIISNVADKLNELQESQQGNDTIIDDLSAVIDHAERAQAGEQIGYSTLLTDLDNSLNGIEKQELIIIAARPGMGKTAFALQLIINLTEQGLKGAFFQLEMTRKNVAMRLVSNKSNVDSNLIRRGNLTNDNWKQINSAITEIEAYEDKLTIIDKSNIDVNQMRAEIKRMKMTTGLDYVIVDYLQLMQGSGENRQAVISEISRQLKVIAKDENILIIALSQLSRAVEVRGGDGRPRLSDLRDSGSIEQDADRVIFLYRAEYYGIQEDDMGRPTQGLCDIIIAKNREGELGKVPLTYNMPTHKFTEFHDDLLNDSF